MKKGLIKKCPKVQEITADLDKCKITGMSSGFCTLHNEFLHGGCDEKNRKIIADYSRPKPAIPAKDWREKADEDEYKFCLQKNG